MVRDENQSTQCKLWMFAQTFFSNYSFPWKAAISKKKKILSDNDLLNSHVICRVFPFFAYKFTFFFFQMQAYLNHLELSGQWFSLHLNHEYVIVLNKFKIKTVYLLFYQSFLPRRQCQLLFFSFVTMDYPKFLQIPTVMWRGTT